tara:strand:- start:9069 stop:9455 length:387 start_codon:yes stop_codon:yes gene_type:complete
MKPLEINDRQRKFAKLLVNGRPAGRAYEEAGYASRGPDADCCAAKLQRNAKVQEYIVSLREVVEKKAIWSLEERRSMLLRIAATNEDGDPRVAISASDQYNKLDGDYAPEKHKINLDAEIVVTIGGNA